MPPRPKIAVWKPRYQITPRTAEGLMRLATIKTELEHTPLPPALAVELRRQARLRSTHYSTRIEGNRLTLAETENVVAPPSVRASPKSAKALRGRDRDVREVRNYWEALIRVEDWSANGKPITADGLRRLHALVDRGVRAQPTPYRTAQNVIRDSVSGGIVYLPPEAKDVPALMDGLVAWIDASEREPVPAPLAAGLAHYQFVTIHPYMDGNGRTARLLATWLLRRGGYGLNGFLALEEEHAKDLPAYYRALTVHPHHNYYFRRNDADLTNWLEYFVDMVSGAFENARRLVAEANEANPVATPDARTSEPPRLDARGRVIFGLLSAQERITAREVAKALGLSERMARLLLAGWVVDGWLEATDASRRMRAYALASKYHP